MDMIVVAGALANKPYNGGAAWTRMSWVTGLRDLGYRVFFVEEIQSRHCVDAAGRPTDPAASVNRRFFDAEVTRFSLQDCATLIVDAGREFFGVSQSELLDRSTGAACLLNISGHLNFRPLWDRCREKVYLDLDPGYTQTWHAAGLDLGLAKHDLLLTIGENMGTAVCPIPTSGLRWRHVRQPVLLADWPRQAGPPAAGFTTIASWRGPYGPVPVKEQLRGGKQQEFRRFGDLPAKTGADFEIALQIGPTDEPDLTSLRRHGWKVADPKKVVPDTAAFRRYVQASLGEFSVAQSVYVHSRCGWFSDRSVRYLASGRPVILQETGFSSHYPTGAGLHAFRTLQEAVHAVETVQGDYANQSRGARELAENYFDSRKVLSRFVEIAGVSTPETDP